MTTEIIKQALKLPNVVGLGEMMNFPGVLAGDEGIFDKLALPIPASRWPLLLGYADSAINAYAGSGMSSDHESTELEEAREKLRRGMMIMIREGSTEHNFLNCCRWLTTDLSALLLRQRRSRLRHAPA